MHKIKSKTGKGLSPLMLGGTLLVIVILAVGSLVYYHHNHSVKTDLVVDSKGSTVNMTPPNASDKQDVDQNKAALGSGSNNQSGTSTDGKRSVSVVISYADLSGDDVQVNSYVSGIFEDGGTCTLTLTNGSKTVTKTGQGAGDASHTDCAPFSIPQSELGSGSWKAVVSYSSNDADGASSPANFSL